MLLWSAVLYGWGHLNTNSFYTELRNKTVRNSLTFKETPQFLRFMTGVATKLLCWKPLVPLSRLTYSAYIIHPVMYAIFYGSREETLDFSYYLLVSNT